MQVALPAAGWNEPALHASQLLEDAADAKRPEAHCVQLVAAVEAEYFPVWHASQASNPSASL